MPSDPEIPDQPRNEENAHRPNTPNYEDDPLIRLTGSGKDIWADEHADEYVKNLRRENI